MFNYIYNRLLTDNDNNFILEHISDFHIKSYFNFPLKAKLYHAKQTKYSGCLF